jgi:hypothetical protein
MPARRSSPKPPKPADAKGDLAALGFRVAERGPHTSKTLMLQELEALLAAVPADAPSKSSLARVEPGNELGTFKAADETATKSSDEKAFKGNRQALKRER